jgi:hypothetical protein
VIAVSAAARACRLARDDVADLPQQFLPAAAPRRGPRLAVLRRAGSSITASRKVLLGIVPVSTQTPPTMRPCSMIGNALAQLGGLDGAASPGRPTADGNQVVVMAHAPRLSAAGVETERCRVLPLPFWDASAIKG